MTEEKSSVKEMLKMDINLKQELTDMFKSSSRKQTITLILVVFCSVVVLGLLMFYVSRPNPVDRMVFEAIQKERKQIIKEREAMRVERDSLRTTIMKYQNLK